MEWRRNEIACGWGGGVLHHVSIDNEGQVDEGIQLLELGLALGEPSGIPPASVFVLMVFELLVDEFLACHDVTRRTSCGKRRSANLQMRRACARGRQVLECSSSLL